MFIKKFASLVLTGKLTDKSFSEAPSWNPRAVTLALFSVTLPLRVAEVIVMLVAARVTTVGRAIVNVVKVFNSPKEVPFALVANALK